MKLAGYADQLDRLRSCKEAGFGFGEAIAVLDGMALEQEGARAKLLRVEPRIYHGIEIGSVAHMGRWREVPIELAAQTLRMTQIWHLRSFITPDTDAVVELGAGAGDFIVSLAREHLGSKTRFVGIDLAPDSADCIDVLAELAGVRGQVENHAFNFATPDLTFLADCHDILFCATNTFSAVDEGDVFSFLSHMPKGSRLCAFEPLHDQINDMFPDHKLLQISRAAAEGLVKVEKIVPEMIGKSPVYSLTLIQLVRL